jgi:hypothetical protein
MIALHVVWEEDDQGCTHADVPANLLQRFVRSSNTHRSFSFNKLIGAAFEASIMAQLRWKKNAAVLWLPTKLPFRVRKI